LAATALTIVTLEFSPQAAFVSAVDELSSLKCPLRYYARKPLTSSSLACALGNVEDQCVVQWLGPTRAAAISAGWDGDRFVAYRNGDNVAFIWATIWDSDADADEFYEQYHQILAKKYGSRPSRSDYYMERRRSVVVVVEGLERQEISQQIDSVWAEMVVEEEIRLHACSFCYNQKFAELIISLTPVHWLRKHLQMPRPQLLR
jgi:hypothetical protein